MALEKIGLGGVLTFDSAKATSSIGKARDAFGRFTKKAKPIPPLMERIGRSVSQASQKIRAASASIGSGLQSLSLGTQRLGASLLPLTAISALGANTAANFEQQMSSVSAKTNGTSEQMRQLTDVARQAGTDTVFSATQAGQAMEFMAISGANTAEIIGGLGGVINAAAAEGIDLAQAADIIAQSTRIMGREWVQAANTADILVRTSQRSNTNLLALGEAMRFGGGSARAAGLDLEEVAGMMGKLADAGLRGSIGGTSLQNALSKLARPSARATAIMRRLGITMTETANGGVDLVDISDQLSTALDGMDNQLEKTNIAVEIFGQRGRRAFQALAAAGAKNTNILIAELRHASDGLGASAEAAKRRLDNFKGAVTLMMSSLGEASIAIFGPLLSPMKGFVQEFTVNLNKILVGIRNITAAGGNAKDRFEAIKNLLGGSGKTFTAIALGVTDAIGDMQKRFKKLRDTIGELSARFEKTFGPDTVRNMVRIGLQLLLAAATLAPFLIGLGAAGMLLTSMGSAIIAAGGALAAAFWPIIGIVGILSLSFLALRKDGTSTTETLVNLWNSLKTSALSAWNDGILPFWNGFSDAIIPAIDDMATHWRAAMAEMNQSLSEFSMQMDAFGKDTNTTWRDVGIYVGATIGAIGAVFSALVASLTWLWNKFSWGVMVGVRSFVNEIIQWWGIIKTSWTDVINSMVLILTGGTGGMIVGIMQIGRTIIKWMLEPLAAVVRWIIAISDATGVGTFTEAQRNVFRAISEVRPASEQGTSSPAQRIRSVAPQYRPRPPRAADPAASTDPLTGELKAAVPNPEALTGLVARRARRTATPPVVEANVDISDDLQVNVNNEVCVDGQQLAIATQRHRTEIGERSGFQSRSWQRRLRAQQGAVPSEG